MTLKNIQRVDNYKKANDFLRIGWHVVIVVDSVKSPLNVLYVDRKCSMYNKACNIKTKHKHTIKYR